MTDIKTKINLGGFPQKIHVRTDDESKPVLLFLHGGPGVCNRNTILQSHADLLDTFTVATWDQRGSGGSYKGLDPETLTIKQLTDDAAELVEWLCKRFNKDKIFVIGGSWGSLLGVWLAKRYPEHIAAFVGFGQVVNIELNEKLSWEFTMEAAKKAGDAKAVKTLEEVGKLLRDAGLRGMGAHISGDKEYTGDGLKKNLDFLTEAGIESMTSAWADYDTADGWRKFGDLMGKAADIAVDWNIPISVHNHCHEFKKVYDGVYAWDLIFKDSSPRLQQQLDTSQVVNPGLDVVERLKKYPGRSFSIHMKENVPMKHGLPNDNGFFGVPPPDGGQLVDFKGTVDYLATEPGFSWYVIECERRPDSLEPAKFNREFLSKLI